MEKPVPIRIIRLIPRDMHNRDVTKFPNMNPTEIMMK